MLHEVSRKLGKKGGVKRFWLENADLLKAARFKVGMFISITYEDGSITIVPRSGGANKVSYRSKTNHSPIIDINNQKLSQSLRASDSVIVRFFENKIVVSVAQNVAAIQERVINVTKKLSQRSALSIGAIFFGFGGLEKSVSEGLQQAGVDTKLVYANEYNSKTIEHSLTVNPVWKDGGVLSNKPIEQVDTCEIPDIDLLTIGWPCVAHSSMQTNKKKRGIFHPSAGLLFLHVVRIIQAKNPSVIIIEQSPNFIKKDVSSETLNAQSVEYYVLSRYLEEAGYDVQTTVVNGNEHGHLETRKRMALVAIAPEFGFEISQLKPEFRKTPVLEDYLDEEVSKDSWKEMKYLDRKTEEESNNFKLCLCGPLDTVIPVITSTYYKIQPSTPIIAHPETNKLRRILTVSEHARIKGFPPSMFEGLSSKAGHSMLGNSVQFNVWKSLGLAIGNSLLGLKHNDSSELNQPYSQTDLFDAA